MTWLSPCNTNSKDARFRSGVVELTKLSNSHTHTHTYTRMHLRFPLHHAQCTDENQTMVQATFMSVSVAARTPSAAHMKNAKPELQLCHWYMWPL
jgi:hypothetical protein